MCARAKDSNPDSRIAQTPQGVIVDLEISQIKPGNNPRRSWSAEKLEQLQSSMQVAGLQEEILVRPIRKGDKVLHYELVDGFRRWTSAKNLKWHIIRTEIREMTDQEVVQYGLLQKVMSEDLNQVDRTDAALQLISQQLGWDPDEVVSLLNRAEHQRKKKVDPEDPGNVTRTQEWQATERFLKTLGTTPEGFRTNWLPILRWPNELLNCVREGKIEYTKARQIARIKDVGQRQQILGEAIAEQLSVRQIADRIAQLQQLNNRRSPEDEDLLQRIKTVTRDASRLLDDPKRRKRVESLLRQLEELLGTEES